MAKTLNLNITERTMALRLINETKASIETLAYFLDDAKNLAVSDEEWTAAKRVITTNDDKSVTWNWDDTVVLNDVELAQQTVDALIAKIQEKSSNNEFTLADSAVVEFDKKLKA